jgi:hypothetical protein
MTEIDVRSLKVADLKRELQIRGLDTSGNKSVLQQRLQEALDKGTFIFWVENTKQSHFFNIRISNHFFVKRITNKI